MVAEVDIWRSAQLMIRRYGHDAVRRAEGLACEMVGRSDDAGGAVWQRICQAIKDWRNHTPNGPPH